MVIFDNLGALCSGDSSQRAVGKVAELIALLVEQLLAVDVASPFLPERRTLPSPNLAEAVARGTRMCLFQLCMPISGFEIRERYALESLLLLSKTTATPLESAPRPT